MQQSAVVLTHPQFDRAKVEQAPRRGRLPKGVVAMRTPREVAEAVPSPADPMDPLTAAYRMLDMMQCTLDVMRRRLAEYADSGRRTG
ncbi:hypothetical protein AVE30378_01008 [Achromobacter veterisilvae]|uniref:Uncharacterized protein n=1 Tax=Achromobacter veterisilvae TaxID=2069367 RepID=A0A446C8Z9_9BURK|nr:hypothetical protein AVE30378_01008 [Achromobacter veterisilvae]